MDNNTLEAIHTCVWGTVALAFVVFLCLAQRSCSDGEYKERIIEAQTRPAVYRAQTEGCRAACGDAGVREVTADKCICD